MHKLQICIWKRLQSCGYLKMDLTTSNCSDIQLTASTVNKMRKCSESQQSVTPVRQHGWWSERQQVGYNTVLAAEGTQHLFMTLWNHKREAENFNSSPNCPSFMSDFEKYCNTVTQERHTLLLLLQVVYSVLLCGGLILCSDVAVAVAPEELGLYLL